MEGIICIVMQHIISQLAYKGQQEVHNIDNTYLFNVSKGNIKI